MAQVASETVVPARSATDTFTEPSQRRPVRAGDGVLLGDQRQAANVTNIVAPTPDPACVADWDSVSYTSTVPHCLRRVDTNLHYPTDLSGEVHHDGQIWSRALWDIGIM